MVKCSLLPQMPQFFVVSKPILPPDGPSGGRFGVPRPETDTDTERESSPIDAEDGWEMGGAGESAAGDSGVVTAGASIVRSLLATKKLR